jgi:DNA-binding LacI/PurR family transcriptional regulator
MQAITEQGRQIPTDFSIVAIVSSIRMAEMMMPPLTTSDAPAAELGSMGARLLIEQLESQAQRTQQLSLPCHLVVRGSSGPCRRAAGRSGK